MAAAAHEGVVCLYSLKSMEFMERELREDLKLNPIHEVSVSVTMIVNLVIDVDHFTGKIPPRRRSCAKNGIPPSNPQ